jgi:hypothetical protein
MSNPNPRPDLPSFTPGFQAGSRMRCQWHARKGERTSLYWQAKGTPTALNWVRALQAIAASAATT